MKHSLMADKPNATIYSDIENIKYRLMDLYKRLEALEDITTTKD